MIRTLVVDDDFRVASIHAAYVEKVPGFTLVGQARSAEALVGSIVSLKPDLILLDLYLPDHHGLDVLKRLRQPSSTAINIDVIVITAANDPASVRTAMQCGAIAYLLKPFGFPAFQEKLVAYREMRRQLTGLHTADQSSVDRLYASLSGDLGNLANRPPSTYTLDAIESVLVESETDLSASDVAGRLGVSRATAQRYLSRLEATGVVTMTLHYRATGRPEHRYRHRGKATPEEEG